MAIYHICLINNPDTLTCNDLGIDINLYIFPVDIWKAIAIGFHNNSKLRVSELALTLLRVFRESTHQQKIVLVFNVLRASLQ